ncbi:histidine phosphatase family protein [Leptospira selangorensis]|uniref:Histidine phosphatase family protein n=1 Tax=Leptospira selangorensis TaxID=2484982 RepID=A0A4R9G9V8_9LEPT|nr:histidine phosphatase family protein [Leptospira selangorensis]TGK08526.1 histidine phosphatase family protein [Leptospira selangorensis]TGM15824.1 histidine phosphatase family protein [Leptospira selangorensis]TGM18226.1 histidine phosphatase family protein [Leptospira selangorensis]
MEIFLVRHTTPEVEPGTCYGKSDLGLPSSFEKEAENVLKLLPEKVHSIRTSPLFRCYSLAEYISKHLESKSITPAWKVDSNIQELDFGDWEGRLWEDLPRSETDPWMEDFVNRRPPGGETYSELKTRILRSWEEGLQEAKSWENLKKEEGETSEYKTIWVSHGGPIRCLSSMVLGFPLENSFRLVLEYGSVSCFKIRFGEIESYPQFVYWNKK